MRSYDSVLKTSAKACRWAEMGKCCGAVRVLCALSGKESTKWQIGQFRLLVLWKTDMKEDGRESRGQD